VAVPWRARYDESQSLLPMTEDRRPLEDRRLLTLRRLALACLLLMLVVTSASAWLRLAQPRPACVDWPGCRSADRPAAPAVAPALLGAPRVLALVRATHRGAATAVLLLVLAMVVLTLARPPRRRVAGRLALALLVLALGLSALGIVTPGSSAAGVLLGNLLGGLLMLALSWRLVVHMHDGPGSSPALARWALLGTGLWALQAGLGALSGSGRFDVAPVAHLSLALLAVPCALGVGWVVRRQGRRREGVALLWVAGLQFVLGVTAASVAAAPALVLLHNVFAALGLALLMSLARR
jgi:heme A synthase